DVGRARALQRRGPRGVVGPVERRCTRSGRPASGAAPPPQPVGDAAAGLAGRADHHGRVVVVCHASESSTTRRDPPWVRTANTYANVSTLASDSQPEGTTWTERSSWCPPVVRIRRSPGRR